MDGQPAATSRLVVVRDFVHSLSPACQRLLAEAALSHRDERTRADSLTLRPSSQSGGRQTEAASCEALSLPLSGQINQLGLANPLFASESFCALSQEVLGQLVLGILQNELKDNAVLNTYALPR